MFDYIVIGAGGAGCVLASGLSENRECNVLLIEAGPPDRKREIHMPAAFSKLFKTPLDWNFATEPQEPLNGRRLYWPRGKMLGGSSSMNAMVYVRGRPADFDGWRDLGNAGWGFEEVLPFFKRVEAAVSITGLRSVNPLSRAFLDACQQTGMRLNPDFNDASQEGAGLFRVMQKNGRRWSAADAYLRPALRRGNLTVWTGIQASRILIENGRAAGVEYFQKGSTQQVRASREVILSAGAIGSPQLLLLSGIGPLKQLEAQGISVQADLPGVGENLQDHLSVGESYFCTQPVSLTDIETFTNLVKYFVLKNGPLTSNIAEAGAFVKSQPGLAECDLEFHFAPVHYIDHGFAKPGGHGFSLGPSLLTPKSRGRITLRSIDPLEPPAIDPGYLSDPADMPPLVEGIRLARRIASAAAFDSFRGKPVFDEDDPEAHIRGRAETLYHPTGTCKMGADPMSVVSPQLEIHGIAGLRVADASVMPVIVGGNTLAATMMIAEKAVQMITNG
ncbi:MAG TPA: GMC family oxidoreductase N-terminal domain-containing protein [Bryobacteraceae bacterium]|nr:GMC family oxidoreductase N-terminal domain-containing protein [Bryobacteraceae bacterium]